METKDTKQEVREEERLNLGSLKVFVMREWRPTELKLWVERNIRIEQLRRSQ